MNESVGIDVIVPFHGRLDLLLECLTALAAGGRVGGCVFLVDDGSLIPPGAALERALERLALPLRRLTHRVRRGFVAAVNHAWSQGTQPTALVLNNDALVPPDLLLRIGAAFRRQAGLAALAPASDNPVDLFQYRVAPSPSSPVPMDASIVPVPYLTAMCLAVRRVAVRTRWLFDPTFSPGYFEDLDLCCRLRRDGWTLGVLPDCQAHHIGRATFGGDPLWGTHVEKNYGTFQRRWRHLASHGELEQLLWERKGGPAWL